MKQPFLYLAVSNLFFVTGCATQQVSYQNDVVPILENRCIKCHVSPDGIGYKVTGLQMDTYESLMQGTVYGPVVIAGDSRRSILNKLVEGRAGQLQRMPHNEADTLSSEQIETLKNWVNEGAENN